jgi:hypothetical protein
LKTKTYKELTIEKAIEKYTTDDPPGIQEKYIQHVTKQSGTERTTTIEKTSDEQKQKLVNAMRIFEDSTPGHSLINAGDGKYKRQDYSLKEGASAKDFSNYTEVNSQKEGDTLGVVEKCDTKSVAKKDAKKSKMHD